MNKIQRVYKTGMEYQIIGPGEKTRRVRFVGKFKIDRKGLCCNFGQQCLVN